MNGQSHARHAYIRSALPSSTEVILMSMGTFDEMEFERREKLIAAVETDSDDDRSAFEGHVEYTDDSVDELLSQFKALKDQRGA